MQSTQQPAQAKPVIVQNPTVTVQTQQPVAGQPVQPGQPVKKKPTRWWILVIVAIVIIGGGIWAYFQFLN